jgi:hypothetical protein
MSLCHVKHQSGSSVAINVWKISGVKRSQHYVCKEHDLIKLETCIENMLSDLEAGFNRTLKPELT